MTPDEELIQWYKDMFASRTPPKSVLDAAPDYRVTWTELYAKMQELGYKEDVVTLRIKWAEMFVENKLRTWCNKLIKATGGTTLVSKETTSSRATRLKYE